MAWRRQWHTAGTEERCGKSPVMLRPNLSVLENLHGEGITAVVMLKLGEVRGTLVTMAVGGEAMEHSGGELAAGKLGLELTNGFASLRRC